MEKTIIKAKHGSITETANILGISIQTVRKALNGNKSVKNYSKIRTIVLKKGGMELQEIENCPSTGSGSN